MRSWLFVKLLSVHEIIFSRSRRKPDFESLDAAHRWKMSALGLSTMRRVARDALQCMRLQTGRSYAVAGRVHWTDRPVVSEPICDFTATGSSPASFGWAAPGRTRGVHSSAPASFAADPSFAEVTNENDTDEDPTDHPSSQYDFANKPSRGINQWKRARKKAAWIKANSTVHRENKTKRAEEREAKRLEKWRTISQTQRAWNEMKRVQATEIVTEGAKAESK